MKNPDKKNPVDSHGDEYLRQEIVSATECAGLIQAVPHNDTETASYGDIYPITKQSAVKKKTKSK